MSSLSSSTKSSTIAGNTDDEEIKIIVETVDRRTQMRSERSVRVEEKLKELRQRSVQLCQMKLNKRHKLNVHFRKMDYKVWKHSMLVNDDVDMANNAPDVTQNLSDHDRLNEKLKRLHNFSDSQNKSIE